MISRQQSVLNLIRQNPFLSQQEMADQLGMSRPALANIVSTLMKDGLIEGRAYILPPENEIIAVGGANVDRKYTIVGDVRQGTSNPATVTWSVGGVARNVAENLGRLGHEVRLLTVAGNDADWQLIEKASKPYMNTQWVNFVSGGSTGSYSAILSEAGELVIALAHMDVYDHLLPSYMEEQASAMRNASLIVCDLNIPKETVVHLKEFAETNNVPFAIVPVSTPKMNRMSDDLKGVTYFICNEDEAEVYTEKSVESMKDWEEVVRILLDKGAQYVAVTAGSKGVMAGSIESGVFHLPAFSAGDIKDVTGAGDSFAGAALHGMLSGMDFETSLKAGLVNAVKTLASQETVRTDLTANTLLKELEELI